jgi:hypothetical protein
VTKRDDEIVAELQRLADLHGRRPTPEEVIEAARPADSPLHSRFTWDDSEAAHQWRLMQARNLLRISIVIEKGPDVVIKVPLFTSLASERGDGYRLTADVRSDEQLSLEADIDRLKQAQAILVRADSPRFTELLNAVALLLAQLEAELSEFRRREEPVA